MGRPKALLSLAGAPLVRWHASRLLARARPVVVVVGAAADDVIAALPAGVTIARNEQWATSWPADSLRLGLEAGDVRGPCLITPVDVPPPRDGTLGRLLAAGAPAVPVDAEGRLGHPVLADAAIVAAIRQAPPAGGLVTLLGGAARVLVDDPLVAEDFDDPDAWDRFVARWSP